MSKIIHELLKLELDRASIDISSARLLKVTTITLIGDTVCNIVFYKLGVSLMIERDPLQVGSNIYKLDISASLFDKRDPYYNQENKDTLMSVDRVLFYIRYYTGAS